MKFSIKGVPADVEFPDDVDPRQWRSMPDPDGAAGDADDDADRPCSDGVVAALGFDPDDEWMPDSSVVDNFDLPRYFGGD